MTLLSSGRKPSLALYGLTMLLFMAASSAPTPVYRLYQSMWSFPVIMLTIIFAAYVVSLLVSLLCFGNWSDHVGRRRIICTALVVESMAMGLFLLADSAQWLIAARLLQGFATGLAMAAMSAALMDINQQKAGQLNSMMPLGGMGLGALLSGILAKYAPEPTHLIFAILLLLFLLQLWRTARADDTSEPEAGVKLSLLPRISVPRRLIVTLICVVPVNMASWALGGFFLSLMPSLLRQMSPDNYQLLGGVSNALLTSVGVLTIQLVKEWPAKRILFSSSSGLIAGCVVLLAGVYNDNVVILLSGAVVAGFGFGCAFLGVLRTMIPLLHEHERAGFMAAVYIISYLSNSVPAVAIGYYSGIAGLRQASEVYIGGIMLVALLCLILQRVAPAPERCPAAG